MALLFVFLSLSAFGLDCKKAKNHHKCAQQENIHKGVETLKSELNEIHKNLISLLESMDNATPYNPLKVKEILKQTEQEWLKNADRECVALNMLVSPETPIDESMVYSGCYEAYARQRLQDLNDFYEEAKRTNKKIKQIHKMQKVQTKSSKSKIKKDKTRPNKETPKSSANSTDKQEVVKPSLENANNILNKGYYLQVGAFMNTPNKDFLQILKGFTHKIEQKNMLMRYLVGPYRSKEEALEHVDEVARGFGNKPILVETH